MTLIVVLCALASTAPADPLSDLDTLAGLMTGSFSSAEQAAENESFLDVRLHVARIWQDRHDGNAWLYVEQAVADALDKPYRQRIYRLSAGENGTFASAVFELPGDPATMAGAWKSPEKFRGIRPDQLVEREGCVVYLRRESPTRFTGSTRARDCRSSLRGATYATTHVTVMDDSMTSWDRGYDENSNQVWGSENGAYVFRRVAD